MRIFNRKFANQFLNYKEQNRFIEGIFIHIGMNSTTLQIEQRDRYAGVSKFNFRRKMRLALDAILDFSELPLRIAIKLGFSMLLIGLLALVSIILLKLFFIDFQAGWPSLISVLIFGFGVQLFFTGIAALYIGRIYKEVKQRPLFSIKNLRNLNDSI
jgi:dolichol-phosphate mannosyltransferase